MIPTPTPPPTTLISFDVGIKNMAYCIFSLDSNNRECKIKDWNVLNFTEYDLEKQQAHLPELFFCQTIIEKKTKKTATTTHVCGNTAKYEYGEGDGKRLFCELHAKKHALTAGLLMPKKEYTPAFLKKQNMNKLHEIAKRDFFMAFYATPELALATEKMKKQDLLNKMETAYAKKLIRFVEFREKVNAKAMDLIYIGRIMKQMLDGISCINEITHIIVENQISTIASRMKTIQGMLAQYFIMRESQNASYVIEFISSSNKLKGLRPKPVAPPPPVDGQTHVVNKNYKANKKDGIDICNQFLERNAEFLEWRQFFNEKPTKKDDLADCFLQGIYYMKQKNIITNADDLKINLV